MAKSDAHIQPEERSTASIPQPVRSVPLPPPPEAREAEIRYSVVVANQPVREVLMAMARETRLNFDIHPGIDGTINLNAIDQTLRQILTRIAKQVDLRWESDGQTITVMPDTPYLRNYKIDYVNMSRDVSGTIGVQSQVVAPPGGTGGASSASANQNSSLLKVDNIAKNRFWETLERNVKDLLRETDKELPEGSSETFVQNRGQSAIATNQARATTRAQRGGSTTRTQSTGTTIENPGETASREATEFVEQRLTFREKASVIVNPESGIVSVRGTSRQQEKVAEFIALVAGAARRQVLIEATVVEVILNDNYQSGVDWSALGLNGLGYSFRQNLIGTNLSEAPFFSIQYSNPNAAAGGSISSTVKLLDSFGNTRVLSSPKIMAINNQTAVLKVVDNRVYFTVQAQVTPGSANTQPIVAFTTTQNVVPVGFVMNVTAQIADNDMVVLNVRPTVSRIIGFVNDPNPDLARVNVTSRVPELQSREFESVLRIPSGQTAILGGLMQDSFEGKRDGLPIASRVPLFGDLVSFRNDTSRKSELVVFLRPVVIRDASLEGDLAGYRRYLPNQEFFSDTRAPFPCVERGLARMEAGGFDPDCAGLKPNPVVPDPPGPGGRL
ncbi:MAG TPA: type II and III secretion system protein [Usitatibacter sp.]|nr:type II and III secretion system protein [Usitatibacter sp.]